MARLLHGCDSLVDMFDTDLLSPQLGQQLSAACIKLTASCYSDSPYRRCRPVRACKADVRQCGWQAAIGDARVAVSILPTLPARVYSLMFRSMANAAALVCQLTDTNSIRAFELRAARLSLANAPLWPEVTATPYTAASTPALRRVTQLRQSAGQCMQSS
jgi:hypothetical protein